MCCALVVPEQTARPMNLISIVYCILDCKGMSQKHSVSIQFFMNLCYQVDHWLEFSRLVLACPAKFSDGLLYLNHSLGPVTYLVGPTPTIADFAVWSTLRGMCQLHKV
jgi:glutathione S-transferase